MKNFGNKFEKCDNNCSKISFFGPKLAKIELMVYPWALELILMDSAHENTLE